MEERPHRKQRRAEYSNNQAHGRSRQQNGDIYHFHGQAEEQHSQTQQAISQLSKELNSRMGQLKAVISSTDDRARIEAFLNSLHFDEFAHRREAVSDAAAETFDWILDTTANKKKWFPSVIAPTYAQQESCETDLFWILGKAGSGKSTMMKFINDDDRTYQLLGRWAGESHEVITAQHFFWHPGDLLQKSIEGLLRSLLHQVCGAVPALIDALFPARWESTSASILFSKPWKVSELWNAIGRLRDLDEHFYFCFFIDGLDECHPPEQHQDLVKRLLGLVSGRNIKICVSSRPRPIIESSLDRITDRKLLLEDLTFNDLQKYSWKQISDAADTAAFFRKVGPNDIDKLAKEIASSARGVFLWVRLVVSSISERVIQGADYPSLVACLREFPLELEDYFRHMVFERIHRTWHRSGDVAKTFKLAICIQTLINNLNSDKYTDYFVESRTRRLRSWKTYHVGLQPSQTDSIDDPLSARTRYFSSEEVEMDREAMRRKLEAITGGLLALTHNTVDFSHRTIYEFLATNDMQILVNENVPTSCNNPAWFSRVLVARQKMQSDGEGCRKAYGSLLDASHYLKLADDPYCHTVLHLKALEEVAIDRFVNHCAQKHTCAKTADLASLLDGSDSPETLHTLHVALRLFESLLHYSCFAFASVVITRWPELLGCNKVVWQAALGLHGPHQPNLDIQSLNLDFLRLLLSHGADPRVGYEAFTRFINGIRLAEQNRSLSPGRRNQIEGLLYRIGYALLYEGASPPISQSYPVDTFRMNANYFARLCDATVNFGITSTANDPHDPSKQNERAFRRTSIRARLWNPISLETSSQPSGVIHAVWVESLQRECWVIGVHEHKHTIKGKVERAYKMEEIADLGLILRQDVSPHRYRLIDVASDDQERYFRSSAEYFISLLQRESDLDQIAMSPASLRPIGDETP